MTRHLEHVRHDLVSDKVRLLEDEDEIALGMRTSRVRTHHRASIAV